MRETFRYIVTTWRTIQLNDVLKIHIKAKNEVWKRFYPCDLVHIWIGEHDKKPQDRQVDLFIRVTKSGNVIIEDLVATRCSKRKRG